MSDTAPIHFYGSSYDQSFEADDFDHGVAAYVLFRVHNGVEEPDPNSRSAGEQSLALWRKVILESKQKNELNKARETILTTIGFPFPLTREETYDETFNAMFNALEMWKSESRVDHAIVPRGVTVGEHQLGEWIHNLRNSKKKYDKGESTLLTVNQISRLDDAGMVWENVADATWNLRYDELLQYYQANGHSKVPKTTPVLGPWVHYQKKLFNKSKLTEEKIEKLNSLDFSL